MKNINENDITEIFEYYAPRNKYIGVLSIPHSGMEIPEDFHDYLIKSPEVLNKDVDFKVNELVDIDLLNHHGIAVLVSKIHRTTVDLNRSRDICVLNWKSNSHGETLVLKVPDSQTQEILTAKYYDPYYEMIKASINELYKHEKGPISFIDLHSMPSKPTEYHLKINPNQKMTRPHFCVSDIEGKSCSKEFIDYICQQLSQFSDNVTQNDPYFGGHVTRHVNKTYENINNIQIEINRMIYMNENAIALEPEKVKELKLQLTNALIKTYEHFSD